MKNRLPPWFKQEIPDRKALDTARILLQHRVRTVCREASCPNVNTCFRNSNFTFMILGAGCSRNCRFCGVDKVVNAKGLFLDKDEPYRIRDAVKSLKLNYVVITSVTRDDLADGGALIFAQTIALIRQLNKDIKIEVLIPDFQGKAKSLEAVLNAGPDVVAHNIETVKRLYPALRPLADYQLSLDILRRIKEMKPTLLTKSSIMLGLGETEWEVIKAMQDLRDSHCDILALGQYLSPSASHYPVEEFINAEQFKRYEVFSLGLGFKSVLSGPLVRSSYQAEDVYQKVIDFNSS